MNDTKDNKQGAMPDIKVFDAPDTVLKISLMSGQARVLFARVTTMAQEAQLLHQTSDTATAAMARLLAVSALMSRLDKETPSLTLTVKGDGPVGRLSCVSNGTRFKIAIDNPVADLPVLPDDRLDVASLVGHEGQLNVIKDYGHGEPIIGISNLVSGDIAQDFAHYFTVSEQTPSILALGAINRMGTVLSAGGILVQALPGCSLELIEALENRIPFYAGISREIYDLPLDALAKQWFSGLEPEVLDETPVTLLCDCSRDRMRRALLTLGKQELQKLADEAQPVPMNCHFCHRQEVFEPNELLRLMDDKPAAPADEETP